jgi:hypothetical protein
VAAGCRPTGERRAGRAVDVGRAVLAVATRPALWRTAVRQLRMLAVPGWCRRAPWLPLPDEGYLRFRLQTMYGDPDHGLEPADLVTYLRWCRAWPGVVARSR